MSTSKAQEKAKNYLEDHNLEKIISEMINSMVHARDPNPLIFMVGNITFQHLLDQILG